MTLISEALLAKQPQSVRILVFSSLSIAGCVWRTQAFRESKAVWIEDGESKNTFVSISCPGKGL